MSKYICSVCGYIYDEQNEAVKFDDLPASWTCPLCGAPKTAFNKVASQGVSSDSPKANTTQQTAQTQAIRGDKALSNAELNVMCTNLAKGCEKQYKADEAGLFNEIADYYKNHSEVADGNSFDEISKSLSEDILGNFGRAFDEARGDGDRGAQRVLTWSEKVSKIVDSILTRYKKEGTAFLQNTKIFVCEICGFIYIGDEAPDICPICKVPKLKIHEVGRI